MSTPVASAAGTRASSRKTTPPERGDHYDWPVILERPAVGSPDVMRALAARLRSNAETIASAGRGVGSRLRSMTFEGPAADRFHDRLMATRKQTEAVAADANELANSLLRAAAEAEAAIAEWERQVLRLQGRGSG